ncbi:FlgO family outer membrane protein [Paraglaciecola sp. 20A4]|uniref:FlgO family outer membrane protein n=1 Tax=Paraglaciecola sp. 20A4 TaxID=2687288 RepID=UPI00140786CD|nr:FlgO family outer membrane protein [Paraglaciecola sp. 20A4]
MKATKLFTVPLICLFSTSCSSMFSSDEAEAEMPAAAPVEQNMYQGSRFNNQRISDIYKRVEVGDVNHYVQGIMQELIANMDTPDSSMEIGVTSFVYLDGNFDETDLLGNQLSESFMHELHQFGLNVLDFKSSDYIRVTPSGDFNFSRDYEELNPDMPVQYVMGGTMVKHQDGVIVNARMISINTKKVLSSAQGFIPASVVNALHRSHGNSGISLKFKASEKS